MYTQFEEEHGLAKRSMSVLDRATKVVSDADKMEVCNIPCIDRILLFPY